MPLWSNTPPPEASRPGMPLIRVPSNKPAVYLVTSEDLIGCDTHFWGGRTIPCERQLCKACPENIPARWHAYLGVIEASTHRHCVLETTAGPAETLCAYRNTYHALRGCRIAASRAGTALNSRVTFVCTPGDMTHIYVPPPPPLELILATLWHTKLPDATKTTKRKPRRTTETLSDVRDQIAHPDPQTLAEITDRLVNATRGPNGD